MPGPGAWLRGRRSARRVVGAFGAGVPQERVGVELTKGFPVGGVVFQAHYRDFDDYRSPVGDVPNSGATDQGFLARVDNEVGPGVLGVAWQSDFGRNIDRPRNNSQTVRFYYPIEDSHRFTSTYDLRRIGGFERVVLSAFGGSYRQVTDQDRYATATRGRTLEEADYDANDFQVRGSAEKLLARARFEFGVDVNGRVNVHATDSITQYDLSGAVASEVYNVSIESARKLDAGAFATYEAAVSPKFTIGAGLRADYVSSKNQGGYFGDHSTSDGARLREFLRERWPLERLHADRPRSDRASGIRPCRTATTADPPAVGSSPAIRISSPSAACSSTWGCITHRAASARRSRRTTTASRTSSSGI